MVPSKLVGWYTHYCFLAYSFKKIVNVDGVVAAGVVVKASASQSVDLEFNPLVESYQKTLKNGIHSFSARRSVFRRGCGEQAGKFACCVLGQGT